MADSGLIVAFDGVMLRPVKRVFWPALRILFFIGFAWFGSLKLFGLMPVPAVVDSFVFGLSPLPRQETLMVWGVFELLIGIGFLVRGFERVALALIGLYFVGWLIIMVSQASAIWSKWLVPTVDGLYVIQAGICLVAAAGVVAYLAPVKKKKSPKAAKE